MSFSCTFPRRPVIFWSQTIDTVNFYLVTDKLRDIKTTFKNNKFQFRAPSKHRDKTYMIEFDLLDAWTNIVRKELTPRKTEYYLVKETPLWWPRLLLTEEKLPLVIVDLTKWGPNAYESDNGYDDEEDYYGQNEDQDDDPFQQPCTLHTAEIVENILVLQREIMF